MKTRETAAARLATLGDPPALVIDDRADLPYLVEHWYLASATKRHMIVRRIREVFERSGFKPGSRVLDLGPGWAFGPLWASRAGAQVVGIDLGADQLRWAQKTFNHARGFALVHGDAGMLPFPDRTFDAIASVEMMEHVFRPDRPKVLREAARVIRPGGTIAISTPNAYSPIELAKVLATRWPVLRRMLPSSCYPEAQDDATTYHPYRYHHPITARDLARGLAGVGFEVMGVRQFMWVFKTLPDGLLPVGRMLERAAEAVPLVRRLGATTLVWAVRR
jgi:ubiquinone/menaquinone biosynthesis C-methylase UbiE